MIGFLKTNTILFTVFNSIILVPILVWPFIQLPNVMLFDAPGSTEKILPWVIVIIGFIYPLLLIALFKFNYSIFKHYQLWGYFIPALFLIMIICILYRFLK